MDKPIQESPKPKKIRRKPKTLSDKIANGLDNMGQNATQKARELKGKSEGTINQSNDTPPTDIRY